MASEAELKAAGEKYVPKDYDPALYKVRHSLAHVMAQAVTERFPQAKPTIGPPVEYGFYYDFDLDVNPTDADLNWIGDRMRQIIKGRHAFQVREITAAEGKELFKDQPYKVELIDGLVNGQDEYGNSSQPGTGPTLTVYRHDTFTDLCRGPHVESTAQLDPKAFKLTQVTGSYWRGDEKNKALKRFHATAWATEADLKAHLARVEEAAKRDHRKVGRELELFMNSPLLGSGFPILLPKGATVRRLLEQFITDYERAAGYVHVYTPDVAKKELYQVSGHWDHYQENMFPPMKLGEDGEEELVLRPMNCPHHILVYQSQPRSYRELPIRIAELGTMYRYERSGVVGGLSRVRVMTLNDAHLFVREDQITEEFVGVLNLIKKAYADLGITEYSFRLSKRDPANKVKYVDDDAMWKTSQAKLREALQQAGVTYREAEDEAAFYGPKVDIEVKDVMGREETLSTIQLDPHLPKQFGLAYKAADDTEHRPFMIHRGVVSTMERMIAYLIELYAGAFPPWLAPVQVAVVPIADRHFDYARQVAAQLLAKDFRVEADLGDKRMNAKIRGFQLQKVPYILVIGDKELEAGAVAVRLRSGEDLGAKPVGEFVEMLGKVVASRTSKLVV